MTARSHIPLVLIAAAFVAALLVRGVWLRGEVFSPADLLTLHEPWRSVAPEGYAPGNPVLSDQVTQFQPWFALTAERAAEGELPLWNPRAAAGQPLIANLQSAVFSPFAIFRRTLAPDVALLAAALAKMALAALGMALLLRRWGRSPTATLLASLAFAFGGFQAVWLGWPQASTGAFLPLLLAHVEARVARVDDGRDASLTWGPLFALLVGAMLLCGHVETALHVSLATGAYAALRLPWRRRAGDAARALSAVAAWSVVGLALAAVQIGPFVDYLLQSHAYADRVAFGEVWRAASWDDWPAWLALLAGVTLWGAAARWASTLDEAPAAWGFAALLGVGGAVWLAAAEAHGLSDWWRLLVHPDAQGHPAPAVGIPFTGERSYVELNGAFVGVLTWPLALLGLLLAPPSARRVFGVLGALAAVAAYRVPGLSALLDRLPLLDVSHNHRLMLVLGLCAAALAAFGVDAVRSAERRVPRGAWAAVAGAVVAFLAAPWVPWPADDAVSVAPAEERVAAPVVEVDGVVPGQSGVHGGVVPVTRTLVDDEPLVVRGWAIAGDRVPDVVVALEQGDRRDEATLGTDDFGVDADVELPFAWRGHPLARLATFRRAFDVASYPDGPIWLTVTLVDGEQAVVVERRAVRRRGATRVAPRWWITGLVAVALLAWGTRLDGRRAATAWSLAVSVAVVVDVGLFADAHHVTAPRELLYPDTPVTDALAALDDDARLWAVGDLLLPPNTAGVYGLSDVRSYDAMELERFEQFLAMLEPPPGRARHPDELLDVAHPLFALLDVGHVLADASWSPPPGAPLEVVERYGDVVVHRYTGPRTRAFVAPRAESLDVVLGAAPADDEERGPTPAERRRHARNVGVALAASYARDRDLRDVIVVEGAGEPITPPGEALPEVAPIDARVEWLERAPEQLAFDVTSDAPGWLVVCDAYHDGWRAWVDDEPAAIVPAFFGLRAVAVPPGSSRVTMTYAPTGFRLGALTSALAALGLALAFAIGVVVRWRTADRRRPAG